MDMPEYVAESLLAFAALFWLCSSLFTPDVGRPRAPFWIHLVSITLMFVGGATKSGPYWLFALAMVGLIAVGGYLICLSRQTDTGQVTPRP